MRTCHLICDGTAKCGILERVVTLHSKGYSVMEIRQGLKDENKVTSHQTSALACLQCSTHVCQCSAEQTCALACVQCSACESPWGVRHVCEVQFVCNYMRV